MSPAPTEDAHPREQRLLTLLEAISRALSGGVSAGDADLAITKGARDLLECELIDERAAAAISGLAALVSAHEARREEEVRRRSRHAALDAILPQVAAATEIDEVATVLSNVARSVLPHDALTIGLLNPDGVRAHFHVVVDGTRHVKFDVPLAFIEREVKGMAGTDFVRVRDFEIVDAAAQRVRAHFVHGDAAASRELIVEEPIWSMIREVGVRSQIRVAVRRGSEMIGGITFISRRPDTFTDDDAAIACRLAERVSLTLAHDRLAAESRRAKEASERAEALEARVVLLQRELEAARGPHAVVGVSKNWREVLAQATRVAGTDTTVLLTGESGTGKEVVARFIHHASRRGCGPFAAINCAALPEQLLEAELFGHEKGAFTGAVSARAGRIEQAAGGVLFLDEVGEMSQSVQAKFLRVLQEREFQRLGSARIQKADVRVIAATNRDLRAAISSGEFREDLFYRLHVFAIHLPPLRERPEDVLALAEHFLKELGATLGSGSAGITEEARDALERYAWPGNARELRNVIERALILSDGGLVHPSHLAFSPATAGPPAAAFDLFAEDVPLPARGVDIEALERSLVQRAMIQVAGNKSKAARLLGLTRAQLYSRLEKYGL